MKFNITKTIEYVGVNDLDLDLFESQYVVPNGISSGNIRGLCIWNNAKYQESI